MVLAVGLALVFLALLLAPVPAGAQRLDPDADPSLEAARLLAERYAPVMMLKVQEAECDNRGEQWEPAAVETVLGNPEVVLRQVGPGDPVLMRSPAASDLFNGGAGIYLDFPGDALQPGCLFERDFRRFAADHQPTVYAYVTTQADRPGQLALQYWFFWYYNLWNNKHEGDWEGIQLLFDASTAAEALTMDPQAIGYAQHTGGERVAWTSERLERDGDRPVVYTSAGSHASYYSQAVFLGRGPSAGFGCDDTTGPSRRLDPAVVLLPESVDDPSDPLAWLMFDGRWGERRSGPYNGPTGPRDKFRWTSPIDWHEGLRSSSVVVPAGNSRGAVMVNAFCSVVEWGSIQVINLQVSPLRLLTTTTAAGLVGWTLLRRTVWSRVAALPVVARRRGGEILRAVPGVFRRRPGTAAMLGLAYVPASLAVGLLVQVARGLPLLGQLLDLSAEGSDIRLIFVLLMGGLANPLAYQFVNGAVAALMQTEGSESGVQVSAVDAARAVLARWQDLLGAALRAYAVVIVLMVSVVGIPWGIRQLVRYQFVAQAVMIDGRRGHDALDRSTELVRGRWFHTAVLTALFNGVAVVVAFAVGLVLLVVVQVLPLWAFSVVVTLTSAVVVPLAAVAQTLLYGDAVAEYEGGEAAQPLRPEPALSGR